MTMKGGVGAKQSVSTAISELSNISGYGNIGECLGYLDRYTFSAGHLQDDSKESISCLQARDQATKARLCLLTVLPDSRGHLQKCREASLGSNSTGSRQS